MAGSAQPLIEGDDIVWSAWGHAAVHRRTGKELTSLAEHNDAFLYGSGVTNLAKVTGLSVTEMEACIARFKAELPALTKLVGRCEEAGRKFGYLQAIDGRWGRIRKQGGKLIMHTALNMLLQMTGSLAMKYGECMAEDMMIAEGVALDEYGYPAFLANVHDECQMEIPENEVEYLTYELTYEVAEGETEKAAIKRVWGLEEKREHIDEAGKMWSAPSVESAADGVITVSRVYHRAGDILGYCFAEAGRFLKMRIPLAAEYKIGDSWHDTH